MRVRRLVLYLNRRNFVFSLIRRYIRPTRESLEELFQVVTQNRTYTRV